MQLEHPDAIDGEAEQGRGQQAGIVGALGVAARQVRKAWKALRLMFREEAAAARVHCEVRDVGAVRFHVRGPLPARHLLLGETVGVHERHVQRVVVVLVPELPVGLHVPRLAAGADEVRGIIDRPFLGKTAERIGRGRQLSVRRREQESVDDLEPRAVQAEARLVLRHLLLHERRRH